MGEYCLSFIKCILTFEPQYQAANLCRVPSLHFSFLSHSSLPSLSIPSFIFFSMAELFYPQILYFSACLLLYTWYISMSLPLLLFIPLPLLFISDILSNSPLAYHFSLTLGYWALFIFFIPFLWVLRPLFLALVFLLSKCRSLDALLIYSLHFRVSQFYSKLSNVRCLPQYLSHSQN